MAQDPQFPATFGSQPIFTGVPTPPQAPGPGRSPSGLSDMFGSIRQQLEEATKGLTALPQEGLVPSTIPHMGTYLKDLQEQVQGILGPAPQIGRAGKVIQGAALGASMIPQGQTTGEAISNIGRMMLNFPQAQAQQELQQRMIPLYGAQALAGFQEPMMKQQLMQAQMQDILSQAAQRQAMIPFEKARVLGQLGAEARGLGYMESVLGREQGVYQPIPGRAVTIGPSGKPEITLYNTRTGEPKYLGPAQALPGSVTQRPSTTAERDYQAWKGMQLTREGIDPLQAPEGSDIDNQLRTHYSLNVRPAAVAGAGTGGRIGASRTGPGGRTPEEVNARLGVIRSRLEELKEDSSIMYGPPNHPKRVEQRKLQQEQNLLAPPMEGVSTGPTPGEMLVNALKARATAVQAPHLTPSTSGGAIPTGGAAPPTPFDIRRMQFGAPRSFPTGPFEAAQEEARRRGATPSYAGGAPGQTIDDILSGFLY